VLGHLFLGRRRQLREISLGGSVVGNLLLRIRSLFEGVVMGPNLILVMISRARRGLLGGRSEASVEVNTVQPIQNEFTGYMKIGRENLRCVNSKLREDLLPHSKRRAAAQRCDRNRAIVVVA
jgi:hypothetical protein